MHNIPTLHSTKPVTCHPIPSVWDVPNVSKVVYPMGHFPVWESFQIGHQSRHFTFSLGLEKSNGIFWQLKSDLKETQSKKPGRVTDTTSEQAKRPLLEDFPPGKNKQTKKDGCTTATSEEFYLIISASQLQLSLMHNGWAKELISHLSLRNSQLFGKGHILKADNAKVCKTHSYKTKKFTAYNRKNVLASQFSPEFIAINWSYPSMLLVVNRNFLV